MMVSHSTRCMHGCELTNAPLLAEHRRRKREMRGEGGGHIPGIIKCHYYVSWHWALLIAPPPPPSLLSLRLLCPCPICTRLFNNCWILFCERVDSSNLGIPTNTLAPYETGAKFMEILFSLQSWSLVSVHPLMMARRVLMELQELWMQK